MHSLCIDLLCYTLAGVDYHVPAGSALLTLNSNSTTANIPITVVDDETVERGEEFIAKLSVYGTQYHRMTLNPENATVSIFDSVVGMSIQ